MILRKERINLHTITQSAVDAASPLIEQRRHQLVVSLPSEPVYLEADAVRLTQIFINLLNNAAKFTDLEGRITVTGEQRDGHVVVTVGDSGIGIAPGMLGTIFDMFSQADLSLERPQAGLGVGLTLARHLVELHGGTIHARSDGLGRGSQFIVDLPVVTQALAADAGAASKSPAAAALSRLRVLCVDDNVDFVDSMAALLTSMGHDVRVAYDGEAGLQTAPAFAPDVMFLDIGLPKLNGYDLARRLRELPATRDALLVAITGWGQEDDKRRAKEAGFAHHMVKPADFNQIIAILASVVPR
jgi:CheY-like chemotaxis protein/two-component sensor histidine kinase